MENSTILQWMEEVCPDKAPITKLSEWELAIIVGQRELIEKLKIKLRVNEEVDNVK